MYRAYAYKVIQYNHIVTTCRYRRYERMNKRETKSAEELLDSIMERQKGMFRLVANEIERITKSLSALVIIIRTEILEDHKERKG